MRRVVLLLVATLTLAAAPSIPAEEPLWTDRLYSPIADVDGDGGDDLVEDDLVRRPSGSELLVEQQVLRVRSSRDHSVLWEWERPARWQDHDNRYAGMHVVRLGLEAAPAVMLTRHRRDTTSVEVPSVPGGPNLPDRVSFTGVTDRVIAFDGATGQLLWERDVTLVHPAAFDEPVIADVLPGAAHELVAFRWGPAGVLMHVVDGQDGLSKVIPITSAAVATSPAPHETPVEGEVEVIDDIDGDGHDDLLLTTNRLEGGDELELVSLGSGTPEVLWSQTLEPNVHHVGPRRLGDVTGDGVPELIMARRPVFTGGSRDIVVDGATGRDVLDLDGSHVRFVGDVDGDPGGEVAFLSPAGDGIEFMDADGTRVRWLDASQLVDGIRGALETMATIGDLDGDGGLELALRFRESSHFGSSYSSVIVYGDRVETVGDGTVTALGDTGHVVNSASTGLILRDGQTLAPLWEVPPVQDYNWPFGVVTADTTGDGTPDVLNPDGGVRITDGRTGATSLQGAVSVNSEWVQVTDWRR